MTAFLKRYGPIMLVGLALIVAISQGWHRYLSFDVLAQQREALQALVAARPLMVASVFVAIYVAATATAMPGAIWLTIGGGFLFGPWLGTALSASSATVGAFLLYLATRSAIGGGLRAKAGGLVDKLERGFKENAFSYLLTLRLLPVAPFFGVNLAAGILGVPARTFLIATAIGILPGGFVYALLGNGLGEAFALGQAPDLSILGKPAIIAPLLGLAALALLPVLFKAFGKKATPA